MYQKKVVKGSDGKSYVVPAPLLARLIGILITGWGIWALGALVAIAFLGGTHSNGYRGVGLFSNLMAFGYAVFVIIRSRRAGHLCITAKLALPQQDGISDPTQGQETTDRIDAEVARRLTEMGIQTNNKPTE